MVVDGAAVVAGVWVPANGHAGYYSSAWVPFPAASTRKASVYGTLTKVANPLTDWGQ